MICVEMVDEWRGEWRVWWDVECGDEYGVIVYGEFDSDMFKVVELWRVRDVSYRKCVATE